MWLLVQAFCAAYVFGGVLVFYLAALTGSGWAMVVTGAAWLFNWWLLWYANKKW